jgi:hypothetical protein
MAPKLGDLNARRSAAVMKVLAVSSPAGVVLNNLAWLSMAYQKCSRRTYLD